MTPGIAWRLAARALLLLALAAATSCAGSPVKITPNEYSERLPSEVVQADVAHCDEIADEVQAQYGPHVQIGDSVLEAASENFTIHNRYKAACLRAKGYVVGGFEPIALPSSAIEEARASHGTPADSGRAR